MTLALVLQTALVSAQPRALEEAYQRAVANGRPLVVMIGVLGGGILFDVAGVLLAIPTITVLKVFISSTARQLKAYGLI